MIARLREDRPSLARTGHVYRAGTSVVLLELLDRDVWLVEAAMPQPDFIGGSEFEILEIHARDLDVPS